MPCFILFDFLRHCRRFSFHERDFVSTLFRLRRSSLSFSNLSSLLFFQTKYFRSKVSCSTAAAWSASRGELFPSPPPPFDLRFFCEVKWIWFLLSWFFLVCSSVFLRNQLPIEGESAKWQNRAAPHPWGGPVLGRHGLPHSGSPGPPGGHLSTLGLA